jgi:uncharacterized protein (TIGR03437 family)
VNAATGIITTVAGNGNDAFAGDGGQATAASLGYPGGTVVDPTGALFIVDGSNNRIREVSGGIITTVAGTGTAGYSGDGGPPLQAALNSPFPATLDSGGNLYVGDGDYMNDSTDNRVREIAGVAAPLTNQTPAIAAVVSASDFGEFTSISPGSWIEIYGSNLSVGTQTWAGADFNGLNAPTWLGSTSVTVGGQAAFVDFISQGQVNALVPSNVATGMQPVTVTVGNLTSVAYNIAVNPVEPGLDAPPSFKIGGTQYAVALFADGTFVLPTGAIAGLASRPAQPGDEIVLYGIGFGPVTPNLPAGQLVEQANSLASFQMSIGGVAVATVPYSGLAPNYTGLYQFNVVVPANAGNGAVPLTFSVGGVAGAQTLYLAVSN